jgi:DNA-directed RNA polymerase specialized sigma24 family protein
MRKTAMSAEGTTGSITTLLERMKHGDHEAVRSLWQRYYPRLVGMARKKLQGARRLVADEDDIALSAFDSFCRRAEAGQFPDLKDRDGLWALLVVFTARKSADALKHHGRAKRGGGLVHGDSALERFGTDSKAGGFDRLQGPDPTPEEAALFAEAVERLLARLPDPAIRQVAIWKMEGFTNKEIASKQGCSMPTVERRLALIRRLLQAP